MWRVRADDERMLAVFDNSSICSSQRDIRVSHFNYRSNHMVGNDSFQKHTARRISLKAGLSPVTNRWAFYTLNSSLDHGTLPNLGITAAHSVLHVRRRDCVQKVEMPRRLCPISKPVQLTQRRLHFLATLQDILRVSWSRTSLLPIEGQLGTWTNTLKPSPDRDSSAAHDGERTGRKSLAISNRTVEPGSILLVMLAQPVPDERRPKYT